MATSRRARIEVRISRSVWVEEVDRLHQRSRARLAAERERPRLETSGLELRHLRARSEEGNDGTRLGGLFKVYVPIADVGASERPFGFEYRHVKRSRVIELGAGELARLIDWP